MCVELVTESSSRIFSKSAKSDKEVRVFKRTQTFRKYFKNNLLRIVPELIIFPESINEQDLEFYFRCIPYAAYLGYIFGRFQRFISDFKV